MERRFFNQTDIKVEERADGGKMLVGYGARFYDGTPGTEFELWPGVKERIAPTAFSRALTESHDVRGLFNHDPSALLGRTSAGTMRLTADKVGLRYEIDMPDTQLGRDIATSIKRGDLSGSSFSFSVGKDGQEWRKEGDAEIRVITDVRQLFDAGPVSFPAYSGTSVAVRSADDVSEAREAYEAHKPKVISFGPQAIARAAQVEAEIFSYRT